MDFNQLKYFQVLANIKHFTKAAKQISISQSALSRSISKLEDELGITLFNRQNGNIHLTQQGQKFLIHTERILREMDTALNEINLAEQPGHGVVNLSFTHSIGGYFLPIILREFNKAYPDIKVKLNQHNTAYLIHQLSEGKNDLCLCPAILNSENLAWEYLWSEELFAVVPDVHPLADRESVTLQELESYPFITLKPSYSLRILVDQFLEVANSHPNIVFEGDDISTVANLVAANLGVSLIPCIPTNEYAGIKYLSVSFPICQRAIGIAWNTTQQLSDEAITFQQFTLKSFANVKKLPYR